MSYATTQAIRETAGLQSRVDNETPQGPVDGSNRVFAVARTPIVDTDYDEEVTTEDVAATVNGVRVPVSAVNPDTGEITLATAPTIGARVRVFYQQSSLTNEYVSGKQEAADSWVDMKIAPYVKLPLSPVPDVIVTAAELYAAGMILYKDYGNRASTDYSTKDGQLKIKEARALLDEYIASQNVQRQNTSSTANAIAATSDPDVFSRTPERNISINTETDDDYFWNRK